MKKLKEVRVEDEEIKVSSKTHDSIISTIKTPYDSVFPIVENPAAQFYLDTMKIYIALVSGTISIEDAQLASEELKKSPEYTKSPSNPIHIPLTELYRDRMVENLKTLSKYNLLTVDSIRSAFNFAVLDQTTEMTELDFRVLEYFVRNPLETFSQAAEDIDIAPRTVSRTLDRIKQRNSLRFIASLDHSLWNLRTVLLFFIPRQDIDWPVVENALYSYPYTKTMLKTNTADLGYISITVPSNDACLKTLTDSIDQLSRTVFEYSNVHYQIGEGRTANLSLFNGKEWRLHELLNSTFSGEQPTIEPRPKVLVAQGRKRTLSEIDFIVASQIKIDCRATPTSISKNLRVLDYDMESRKVAASMRKLQSLDAYYPYVSFGGVGLSASFCFEIICNDPWKNRILSLLPLMPVTVFNVTSNGIIVWLRVPSKHQVDYYQNFRSLEKHKGVDRVNPIMTIGMKGSRSILDLTKNLHFSKQGWIASPESFSLSNYLADLY